MEARGRIQVHRLFCRIVDSLLECDEPRRPPVRPLKDVGQLRAMRRQEGMTFASRRASRADGACKFSEPAHSHVNESKSITYEQGKKRTFPGSDLALLDWNSAALVKRFYSCLFSPGHPQKNNVRLSFTN